MEFPTGVGRIGACIQRSQCVAYVAVVRWRTSGIGQGVGRRANAAISLNCRSAAQVGGCGIGSFVQLAAVHGIGTGRVNRTCSDVTQGYRAACAHQIHFVARRSGRSARCVNIGHRGIELNRCYTASAADVGYGTLAVNKINGIAMGDKIFVNPVALYGEAGVQYVVDGGGVVAFVGRQGGAVVTGRVGNGCSGIGQIVLHVGQGGRCGCAAGRILQAGNHIRCCNLVTCTVGCIVEVAVGVFVHLGAVGFGVCNRSLVLQSSLHRFQLRYVHGIGIGRTCSQIGQAAVHFATGHKMACVPAQRNFAIFNPGFVDVAGNDGSCVRFVGGGGQIRIACSGKRTQCHVEVGIVFNPRAIAQC